RGKVCVRRRSAIAGSVPGDIAWGVTRLLRLYHRRRGLGTDLFRRYAQWLESKGPRRHHAKSLRVLSKSMPETTAPALPGCNRRIGDSRRRSTLLLCLKLCRCPETTLLPATVDRKSTRLNSSHVKISY